MKHNGQEPFWVTILICLGLLAILVALVAYAMLGIWQ